MQNKWEGVSNRKLTLLLFKGEYALKKPYKDQNTVIEQSAVA